MNHIADILAGADTTRNGITIQEKFGILLENDTKDYWPVVEAVCDATPGIWWIPVEGGALGIRVPPSSR